MISPDTGFAWEKGAVKVDSFFKTQEQWDSNVFYDHDDPQHDFITILTPGIAGEYGFGVGKKHKIWTKYLCEMGIFGKYDEQNYGNHDAQGGIFLDMDKYTVDVNNRFQFTSDRAGTEFENRTLRKIDTLNAVVGWNFNKFSFDTGYQFYIVNFLSDVLDGFNRYENTGFITGYIEIAPKTKGLLEFTYTNLQYPDASGRNGNAYRGMAGVKGDITAKLTGIAKAGYKYKAYENSTMEDYSNAAAEIALVYAINDKMDTTFSYTREPFESTYSNNNYYIGDHFLGAYNYRFGNGFLFKTEGMYFHNDYPNVGSGETKKRRDDEWAVGPRLEYAWKEWIVVGIEYKFHQRHSTITLRTYDENVVSSDVMFKF